MRIKNTPFTFFTSNSIRSFASTSKCKSKGYHLSASRTSFDPGKGTERPEAPSTVYRGTQFEHRSRALLQEHLSMSLRRVGGKGDGGVDLQGWWWLPGDQRSPEAAIRDAAGRARRRIRVLAQCKAERKKMGPNYVREMEGVLHRHVYATASATTTTTEDRTSPRPREPIVALLISESSFTKAAILRALSSPVPFLLIHLPPSADADLEHHGRIGSITWNPALSAQDGILKGEFELRWERPGVASGTGHSDTNEGRPGLWWNGGKVRSWIPEGESDD